MNAITALLEQTLKLKVNAAKRAVARPRERKFLGSSMTWHSKPKLKIAPESRKRMAEKIRLALRHGRGQSMQQIIKGLNAVLRGWMAYFRLTEVKNVWRNSMAGSGTNCGCCCGGNGNISIHERGI